MMILPDVNILLYAYDVDAPHHTQSRAWWEEILAGSVDVGLAWAVVFGFIRISTHRKVFNRPLPVESAIGLARQWLVHPRSTILIPGESHGEVVFSLLTNAGTAGDLTTDAHLAALAIEYRAEVATTDQDFARFPGVKWFNPLTR